MSGCIRQRLGLTKKRLKDRIKQTQTFLQHDVTLDESENKANQLLLKLEGNLKSYKDLLEQLQEIIEEVNDRTEEGCKSTTFLTILSSLPIEKQEDLCGLLLRLRIYKVALTADIEKAFLQVGLQTADRDVTRFLWLKDPTKPLSKDNLQIYRFTRVPFRVISSLFLLGATILHHLEQAGTPTAEKIMKHIYVDNLLTGVNSSKEAKEFYSESKEVFQESSMNLREWGSNSKEFLKSIPERDRVKETITKVLGIL